MELALAKLLKAMCHLLPELCPVHLTVPGQLIDLRRNEFMAGIAVALLDP